MRPPNRKEHCSVAVSMQRAISSCAAQLDLVSRAQSAPLFLHAQASQIGRAAAAHLQRQAAYKQPVGNRRVRARTMLASQLINCRAPDCLDGSLTAANAAAKVHVSCRRSIVARSNSRQWSRFEFQYWRQKIAIQFPQARSYSEPSRERIMSDCCLIWLHLGRKWKCSARQHCHSAAAQAP